LSNFELLNTVSAVHISSGLKPLSCCLLLFNKC
jgi:hypothetical protein